MDKGDVMRFEKYRENLMVVYPYIYSYNTNVAEITEDNVIVVNRFYSKTTSKHINYVASILDCTVMSKI